MKKGWLKCALPVVCAGIALLTAVLLPDASEHPEAAHPYFTYVLLVVLAVTASLFVLSFFNEKVRGFFQEKAPFYAGVILFCLILNLLTVKTATLPVLYFPSLDRIFGVLIADSDFIATCLLYSLRLLLVGWALGALCGMVCGVAIGFSKHVRYWIYPLVRILGPIPSTAWIPLVLISFPTVISASTFLIGLAVWFPTTILTASGIAGIPNVYFEAASTLGASTRYSVFHVGIPAAMPNMFIGLFNGTTASFITLVTAEMLGAKYGIGWYINWQKDMMSYANVYAGLIVMSVTCYLLITLLFKFRDRVLVWQKGVIRW